MSQPSPYNRVTSFQTYQQSAPTSPLPGNQLDAELNAVKATLDQVLNNIKLIQRDDGRLANASVGRLQLDASLNLGFNPPQAWASGVSYTVIDTVFINGKFYSCLVSHISGVFATDLAALKWKLIADFAGVLNSAVNVAFTPTSTIASTNTQAAVETVDGKVTTLQQLGVTQNPPVAPTQVTADNSTKVATTGYVQANVALLQALIDAIEPIGTIKAWPGAAVPNSHWEFCDGGTYLRSNAALFAVLSTTYGAGDGATTANKPDLRGRVLLGKDTTGGRVTTGGCGFDGNVLGNTGGLETHALTAAQLAPHTHSGTTGTESAFHHHPGAITGTTLTSVDGSARFPTTITTTGSSQPQDVLHTHDFTTNSTGSGQGHPNVQPSLVLNYIIRVS